MFNFERDYDWKGLVAANDPEGPGWVATYLRETREIHELIKAAAAALRRQRSDESRALLERAEALRRDLLPRHPSLFHVIGRFYFGGLAFHHYRLKDLDQADRTMIDAGASIQAALEMKPFLLPFAAVSLDIPLKRARVALARSRWQEMREHAAFLRDAVRDRRPLFVLSGAGPVYHSTIFDRLKDRPGLPEALLPGVEYLADRSLREEVYVRMLAQLYLMPGLLIPYP